MPEPTISSSASIGTAFSAAGGSFIIHEWTGSGPAAMHVHHSDDEAWHVLTGTLRFRFADRSVEVSDGGTVFVPAGVAHTYETLDDRGVAARYLIILTPRLDSLIRELQQRPERSALAEIYRRHASELLE
jgi:uncharacterized cupin superfamily protein